jgi:nitroreductase
VVVDVSSNFPDTGTISAALSLAMRAPSVHNTQPWRWRIGDESLNLYADPALRVRHADPVSRDLIISCGAALNHCALALAALGWQSKIRTFPNPADPYHLASIEVQPWIPSEADVALAAAISRRCTDRRPYSPRPVSLGDIALMGARAARLGVTMRCVEQTSELWATLARAAHEHVNDADYLAEPATWSGRHALAVGVGARSTPNPEPAARVPGRIFADAELAQLPGTTGADGDGILVALGTFQDDPSGRLRAGEATSLVLLTATALGMATCPVTEPMEIAATRDAIQTEVFGMDAFPQMLIRVGWAAVNADSLPCTPRSGLADVVTRLDGSTFA